MVRNEDGVRHQNLAGWMLAYGALIASLPAVLRLIISDSTASAQYGSGWKTFLFFVIIPCAAIGLFLAIAGNVISRLARTRLGAGGAGVHAVVVGSSLGILGAYPLGIFVSSPQLPIDPIVATCLSGIYLAVAFGGYSWWRERVEAQRASNGSNRP